MSLSCSHWLKNDKIWKFYSSRATCSLAIWTTSPQTDPKRQVICYSIYSQQVRYYKRSSLKYISKPKNDNKNSSEQLESSEVKSKDEDDDELSKAQTSKNQSLSRPRAPKFSPFSATGRQQLKDLVQELQTITKDTLREKEVNVNEQSDDIAGQPSSVPKSATRHFPESPITRKLKRQRIRKRRASWEENKKLENNPWAQILAGNVRMCQASNARVPKDLMISWGLVKNPHDGNIYLMPDELSDTRHLLDKDERASEPSESNETKIKTPFEVEKGALDKSREDDPVSDASQATATQQRSSRPYSPLRIIPYHNLIRHLSQIFVRQDWNPSSKQPSTIASTMSRIFPQRWKQQFALMQHYYRNRKTTDVDQQSETPFEAQMDLSKVQWQADIPERVLNMMRQRVLTALINAATTSSTGRGLHQRRIMTLSIPENGKLSLQDGKLKDEVPLDHALNSSSDESGTEWLSGSCFLYIGSDPDNLTNAVVDTHSTLDPLPSNPLIPPMIQINDTNRLPVFPLYSMLGQEKYIHEMKTLLEKYEVFQYNSKEIVNHDEDPKGYLVLIKSLTKENKNLALELWQLWRYLGGSLQR